MLNRAVMLLRTLQDGLTANTRRRAVSIYKPHSRQQGRDEPITSFHLSLQLPVPGGAAVVPASGGRVPADLGGPLWCGPLRLHAGFLSCFDHPYCRKTPHSSSSRCAAPALSLAPRLPALAAAFEMGVYRPSLEGDASQAAIEAEEEEELAPFVTGSFSATPQQVSEACAQSYPTCRASRRMAGSRAMHSLAALPQAALLAIARLLPPLERRTVLPLVCKRFAALAAASDLWEQVQLSLPADFAQTLSVAALYAWFVARAGQVRSLHVDMSGEAAWAPLLAVLGVVGRGLQHLRLAGDGAACALPGCTAPWLALTPNLHSLELDEVCDAAVADALWPPGGCCVAGPCMCHVPARPSLPAVAAAASAFHAACLCLPCALRAVAQQRAGGSVRCS